jgi:hypothetical protein
LSFTLLSLTLSSHKERGRKGDFLLIISENHPSSSYADGRRKGEFLLTIPERNIPLPPTLLVGGRG